jgi:hypothetical protein
MSPSGWFENFNQLRQVGGKESNRCIYESDLDAISVSWYDGGSAKSLISHKRSLF